MNESLESGEQPVGFPTLIGYHQHRPWSDASWGARKPSVDDPCGDCGKAKSEHPIPMLVGHTSQKLTDRVLAMENALRYIAQPTMGFDSSRGLTPEEFARSIATDSNVRQALETCIRTATEALRG